MIAKTLELQQLAASRKLEEMPATDSAYNGVAAAKLTRKLSDAQKQARAALPPHRKLRILAARQDGAAGKLGGGSSLRCTKCGRRPQARATRLEPDGTLTHQGKSHGKPCGGLVEDTTGKTPPSTPAKAPSDPTKAPSRAPKVGRKATRRAPPARRVATGNGIEEELQALQRILELHRTLSLAGQAWLKARLEA